MKTVLPDRPLLPLAFPKVSPGREDIGFPGSGTAVPRSNEAPSLNLKYLTANDHLLLMSKAETSSFSAGEVLIREGLPSKAFYMIRSGTARVTRGEVELARFGAGSVCGEMTLLEASSASASVSATETLVADWIAVEEMHGIFLAFPHLASRFYRSIALTLSSRLRETSRRLTQLDRNSAMGEQKQAISWKV